MAVTKRAHGCTLNTTAINARVLSNCGAELAACGTDASSPGNICMSFGGACGVSGCISKLVAELIDDYYNYYGPVTDGSSRGNIGKTDPEYQAISACYREAKCPPESDEPECVVCAQVVPECSASCNKCDVTPQTCDTCSTAVCAGAEDATSVSAASGAGAEDATSVSAASGAAAAAVVGLLTAAFFF